MHDTDHALLNLWAVRAQTALLVSEKFTNAARLEGGLNGDLSGRRLVKRPAAFFPIGSALCNPRTMKTLVSGESDTGVGRKLASICGNYPYMLGIDACAMTQLSFQSQLTTPTDGKCIDNTMNSRFFTACP